MKFQLVKLFANNGTGEKLISQKWKEIRIPSFKPIIFCDILFFQEPGTDAEIKEFAAGFGVKFDMFSKIEAVNGEKTFPLYRYLKAKQPGPDGYEGA